MSVDVTIPHCGRELRVTGSLVPYVPARVTGRPDDWAPAEGGCVELARVFLVRGRRERELPAGTAAALLAGGLEESVLRELEAARDD